MKSAPALEIKGTTLAMTVLQAALRSGDLPSLADSLSDQYGPNPDFFSFEPTIIDLAELPADTDLEWGELLPLLRRYQVAPIGAPTLDFTRAGRRFRVRARRHAAR